MIKATRWLSFLFVVFVPSTTIILAQDKAEKTITGTVVDTYCLITMKMSGQAHKKCAAICAKNGVPIGIKEDKTGIIYLAQSQKDMMFAAPKLMDYLEERVTVKGTVHEQGGMKVVLIESISKAK